MFEKLKTQKKIWRFLSVITSEVGIFLHMFHDVQYIDQSLKVLGPKHGVNYLTNLICTESMTCRYDKKKDFMRSPSH